MNHDLMVFIVSLMNIPVKDRLLRVFFDKRKTSFPVYTLSFMYYVAFINIFSLLRVPNASIPIWFTTYILLSMNFEGSWKKRFTAAISLVGIGVIVDLAIAMSLGVYYTTFSGENLVYNDLSMILYVLIGFLVSALLSKFRNLSKNVSISIKQQGFILAMPISSVMLMFIIAAHTNMPASASILTGIIIFGINVLAFYLQDSFILVHEKLLKSALHAQEKEYYFTQCHLMQESVEQIKSIRHDMKIHLATVKGYAAKINADEIADYISSLLDDIGEAEIYSNTGNIAVDSIINYKLKNVKQEGIELEIRLALPPSLNVGVADLATILGNLLDNALTAVATLAEDEEKRIKLDIEFNKDALVIQLDNSFDGIVKYNENTIVTRKDENHHGHGLKNIKKSVEKYNGYVDITHEDKVFSVAVLLCVEP